MPLDTLNPKFGDWRVISHDWHKATGEFTSSTNIKDFVVVGDTLYAAAWTSVAKISLTDMLDSLEYKYLPKAYPHLQDSINSTESP
jgi:hypothetical protein